MDLEGGSRLSPNGITEDAGPGNAQEATFAVGDRIGIPLFILVVRKDRLPAAVRADIQGT